MAGCRYFPLSYWGTPTPAVSSGDNPHWEILQAVKTLLTALPGIDGLPTPKVRELPYVLAAVDTRPLCFVCPLDGAERVDKHLFGSGATGTGRTWWKYPVLVLLIFDANRTVSSGLEARLQLRHDVGHRLFSTALAGAVEVFDCDPDPKAVLDVQAALGTNFVVSGFQMTYKRARARA